MIEKALKLLLPALLLLCLLEMPYGYYQLVRFVSTVTFIYFAFIESDRGNRNYAIIYVGLAALFQPFIKVYLGREIWNIVDVIVAIFLLYQLFVKENKQA